MDAARERCIGESLTRVEYYLFPRSSLTRYLNGTEEVIRS